VPLIDAAVMDDDDGAVKTLPHAIGSLDMGTHILVGTLTAAE
jgi:hypothetical protein